MVEIKKSEFKARRERLLAQMDDNSIALVPAAASQFGFRWRGEIAACHRAAALG